MESGQRPAWYAVRTRSRAEKIVREQLTNRGIEALLPLVTRISQWKDRRKRIEWPLFPGYCFAKFGSDQKLGVLQSPGVVEIIGSASGRPEPIPEAEIVAIQRVMQSRREYESHPHLEEGMAVEVIRGPLAGVQGKLVRKSAGCRIVISINLIRQAASVAIDADDVRPVRPFVHTP
ncbi:UpxY family transcription antiterminator [Candidatus Nitrospira bockiana]